MSSTSTAPAGLFFGLIRLIRPQQWIKNMFVLAPVLFTGQYVSESSLLAALYTSLLFCVASSAAYTLNDYYDVEEDRRHSLKSVQRPLASGQVAPLQALTLLGGLYVVLGWGYLVLPQVMTIILVYLILNLAYTLVLKHIPIVDLISVAVGFVLRIYAGAVAIDVPVSVWMGATTFFLALYLVAIKRRQELLNNDHSVRRVLIHYTQQSLEHYALMAAVIAIVFYIFFTIASKPEMFLTIPFVLFGMHRYWRVMKRTRLGESPSEVLFTDWQISLTLTAWVVVSAMLYWPGLT